MPIIKNCKISICNDSSFSHLSSAIGIPTIVLMADTPLLYGSYSPQMHPIIPDGQKSVTHDSLGKNKINPNKILSPLNLNCAKAKPAIEFITIPPITDTTETKNVLTIAFPNPF